MGAQFLKSRIKSLRFLSRVVSSILSITVFVPLALTVHKFLSTKDILRIAPDPEHPGEFIQRTAWAKDSKTWPTYMYFAFATLAVVFNNGALLAYFVSAKLFSVASKMSTLVTGSILIFNFSIWGATVIIYRYEKNLHNKPNDLWGWTCSAPAKALQTVFHDVVPFNTYCNIQACFPAPSTRTQCI